jgi:alkyl hydroperoxide reductase subunit AhpC
MRVGLRDLQSIGPWSEISSRYAGSLSASEAMFILKGQFAMKRASTRTLWNRNVTSDAIKSPFNIREESSVALQLGDTAPDFSADTTDGRIDFHKWSAHSWVILFSHPKDFTPVCTTELGYVARLKPELDKRDVKAIGLSVDVVESHRKWAEDIRETQGYTLNFPIIADSDRAIARLYGMIHPQHDDLYTVRSVFVIDPKHKIRLTITYPQTAGRNFEEILRVVDSLQLTDAHSVSTPVNWHVGDDVIILPSVSNVDAAEYFPKGWREQKPYLRLTPDPRFSTDFDIDSSG